MDTTKAARSGHASGLQRVSSRLLAALGDAATPAAWDAPALGRAGREDWFLTPELFDEEERPGFARFLASAACRKAALYHDAIPLRHPEWTWPRSVARHPGYLALLARFDLVLAVSEASRRELLAYWRWLGLAHTPHVESIPLGADFDGAPRVSQVSTANASVQTPASPALGVVSPSGAAPLALLCVGIIEPRKNQVFLAERLAAVRQKAPQLELHFCGRVNPHFGKPMERRLRELARSVGGIHLHGAVSDRALDSLYSTCAAAAFPSVAEGCGLPLLESLWRGRPVLASDLPSLRENATPGGCLLLPAGNAAVWEEALLRIAHTPALLAELSSAACSRRLPSWADTAAVVRTALDH